MTDWPEVCVAMQSRPALKTLPRRTAGHSHAESWGGRHPGSPDRPSKLVVASETCERRRKGGPRSSSFMGLLDQGDSLDRSSKGLAERPEREVPDAVQVSWYSASALVRPGDHAIPQAAVTKQTEQLWGWTPARAGWTAELESREKDLPAEGIADGPRGAGGSSESPQNRTAVVALGARLPKNVDIPDG